MFLDDPLFDSACPLCGGLEDGDEEHYLFECRHFADRRRELIGELIERFQSNLSRIMSMRDLSTRDLNRLARFLGEVMETLKEQTLLDDTIGYGIGDLL